MHRSSRTWLSLLLALGIVVACTAPAASPTEAPAKPAAPAPTTAAKPAAASPAAAPTTAAKPAASPAATQAPAKPAAQAPLPAPPGGPIRVRIPLLTAGVAALVQPYIKAKGLDAKHGIDVDDSAMYESVATLYQDFYAGQLDVVTATWDSFAAAYLRGTPIQMVGTLTTGDLAGIIVNKNAGLNAPTDLRGKQVAAPTGTGTYRMAEVFFRKFYNLELNTDVPVQNAPNQAAALTFVSAGRADAGLSWEPTISIAEYQNPELVQMISMGEMFRQNTGETLYYFVIAARSELLQQHPDLHQRLVMMFHDATTGIMENPDEAIRIAAERIDVDQEALIPAVKAGRMHFAVHPVSEPTVRKSLRFMLDFMTENGVFEAPVPDSFFHP